MLDLALTLVGALLIAAGLFVFVTGRKGPAAAHEPDRVETVGLKIQIHNPALLLVMLGVGLMLAPRLLPQITGPEADLARTLFGVEGNAPVSAGAIADQPPPAQTLPEPEPPKSGLIAVAPAATSEQAPPEVMAAEPSPAAVAEPVPEPTQPPAPAASSAPPVVPPSTTPAASSPPAKTQKPSPQTVLAITSVATPSPSEPRRATAIAEATAPSPRAPRAAAEVVTARVESPQERTAVAIENRVVPAPPSPLRVVVVAEADANRRAGIRQSAEEYSRTVRDALARQVGEIGRDGAIQIERGEPGGLRRALARGADAVCSQIDAERIVAADLEVIDIYSTIDSAYWPNLRVFLIDCERKRISDSGKKRLEPVRGDSFPFQSRFIEETERFLVARRDQLTAR